MKRQGLTMQASRDDMALALKTYRLRAGLTQEELAKQWGTSRYTLLRIERGKACSWMTAYRIFAKLSDALARENAANVVNNQD